MIVDVALYQNGKRTATTPDISDQVDIARANGGFVWVGLAEPSQEEFDHIIGELNFHPLAVEDAVSAKQRPKIEDYGGLTFLLSKQFSTMKPNLRLQLVNYCVLLTNISL